MSCSDRIRQVSLQTTLASPALAHGSERQISRSATECKNNQLGAIYSLDQRGYPLAGLCVHFGLMVVIHQANTLLVRLWPLGGGAFRESVVHFRNPKIPGSAHDTTTCKNGLFWSVSWSVSRSVCQYVSHFIRACAWHSEIGFTESTKKNVTHCRTTSLQSINSWRQQPTSG